MEGVFLFVILISLYVKKKSRNDIAKEKNIYIRSFKECDYIKKNIVMLHKLPEEILFKIVREYIDYEEKVRLMNDPFFKKILLTEYAWKILPKIPLQCLTFISQQYLHIITSGFYVSKAEAYDIFTVHVNKQTGSVTIEGYEVANHFTIGLQKKSPEIHYQTISDLKEMLLHFKRSYHFTPAMNIDSKSYTRSGYFFSNAVRNNHMFTLNEKPYMYASKTLKNTYEYDYENNRIKTTYFYKKRNMV